MTVNALPDRDLRSILGEACRPESASVGVEIEARLQPSEWGLWDSRIRSRATCSPALPLKALPKSIERIESLRPILRFHILVSNDGVQEIRIEQLARNTEHSEITSRKATRNEHWVGCRHQIANRRNIM